MTIFRLALYRPDGTLERASEAFPNTTAADPQTVADVCARAADAGCTYPAGTYLVWADRTTSPPKRIEDAPDADGRRSFGEPPT